MEDGPQLRIVRMLMIIHVLSFGVAAVGSSG